MTPFAVGDLLVTPYRALAGATHKNDTILATCAKHPERFLVSWVSGDPRIQLARALTSPDNLAWEVWQNGTLVGILLLDRIVAQVDARWQFVFFDDGLASKVALLREFVRRCFADLHLQRLTFEVPEPMATAISFARRKLGFRYEGGDRRGSRREFAYWDGAWRDLVVLRLLSTEAANA